MPTERLHLVLLALPLAILLAPITARACSCVPAEGIQVVGSADLLFLGRVVEINDPSAGARILSGADRLFVRFDVETMFKGEPALEVEVATVRDGAACGYTFREGIRYVVVAHGQNGLWSTGLCSGTARADRAADLLALLDTLDLPTLPGRFDRELVLRLIAQADTASTLESRTASIRALGAVAKQPRVSLAALERWFREGTVGERVACVFASTRFRGSGPRVRPLLVEALADTSGRVRESAARGLPRTYGQYEYPAVVLTVLHEHPDPEVRRLAASGLGGRGGVRAGRDLVGALDDGDPGVRLAVVEAAGRYGDEDRYLFDPLVPSLEDPDPFVRSATLRALWRTAPDRALPLVESGLVSPDSVRRADCLRLATRNQFADLESSLRAGLADPSSRVRREAWEAWRILHGIPVDSTTLIQGFRDPDARVRLAVLGCLSNRGETRDGFRDTPFYRWELAVLTRDPSPTVRDRTLHVVIVSGLTGAFAETLIGMVDDPDAGVRRSAVLCLRRVPGTPEIRAALERALGDRDPDVREAAAYALEGGR